jgi:dTDP-4-amino-4,6-dideoxygalactose transaminase
MPYYAPQYEGGDLPHADRFTDCLLRLPMFFELRDEDVHDICDCIATWIQQNSD